MKLVVVMRQTENWDQLNADKYWSSSKDRRFWCFTGQDLCYRDMLLENMSRWNLLRMDFFEYRHALKEIVSKILLKEPIGLGDAIKMKGKDIVFLPIDDDDLVKPGLFEVLQEKFQDPSVEAVTWKTWCCSLMGGRETYFVEPNSTAVRTPSNCYAIRGDVANHKLLINHLVFADAPLNKVNLEEEWGLRFLHPAGMYASQRRNTLHQMFPFKRTDVPPQLNWAKGVIDEVVGMTSNLSPIKMML